MEVESDPPGAKIEFENEYFGVTPCVVPVRDTRNGCFRNFRIRYLRAIPSVAGQYVQTKTFMTGDPVPKKVFFNMNISPVTPEIDVNVTNY